MFLGFIPAFDSNGKKLLAKGKYLEKKSRLSQHSKLESKIPSGLRRERKRLLMSESVRSIDVQNYRKKIIKICEPSVRL